MASIHIFSVMFATMCMSDVTKKATGATDPCAGSGEKFEDLFNKFDDSLWFKVNDELNCAGFQQCIYTKEENVEIHSIEHMDKRKPKASEMQLLIRNDCDESHCCSEEYCTPYTSGQLMSLKTYGYGSFIFHARAISTFAYSNSYHDVWSCMSIETLVENASNAIPMGFSVCIPSESPHNGVFIWNYNGTVHDEIVTLPINAGRRFAVYRIDWTPEGVSWMVNGELMMQLSAHNFTLPVQPLHIKASIIPQRTNVSPEPLHQAHDIELRFRLRAVKAVLQKSKSDEESTHEKTELFTMHTSATTTMWIASGGLMVAVFVIWSLWEKKTADDFYAPLNERAFQE